MVGLLRNHTLLVVHSAPPQLWVSAAVPELQLDRPPLCTILRMQGRERHRDRRDRRIYRPCRLR
jgi:hypothetical protein